MEKVQSLANLAVISPLSLFQSSQVFLEVFLVGPGRTINALQHFVARIAAPIRAGNLHQFECAEPASVRHMRPTTQIGEIALSVKRNILPLRNVANDFGLVLLSLLQKEIGRHVSGHHLAPNRHGLRRQFLHLFLNSRQIFRRKRTLVGKVVVKTVVHHGPYGHLSVRKQRLDRLRQKMRRGMADNLNAFSIPPRNDSHRRIRINDAREIDQLTINPTRQGGLRQASANRLRHFHQ